MNRQHMLKPTLLGVGVSLFFVLGWGLPVVVYLPLAFVLAGALTLVFKRSALFDGGGVSSPASTHADHDRAGP